MIRSFLAILLLLAVNGRAASYSTSFPDTQTPLGAPWIQGQATGGSWKNVNCTPGFAYGTQTGSGGYDDSTAVLSGSWASDQTAQATVVVRQGTSNIAEVELRLRTSISSGRITGYEFNFSVSSAQVYCQIVRWNGAFGNFNLLDSRAVSVHSGDVVKATAVGNALTIYVNGAARFSVNDSTFTNGSPGIGFYQQSSGNINQSFGLTNFSASDSGGVVNPTPTPQPTPTPGATWNNWKTQLLNSVDSWINSHPPIPD